MNDMDFALSAFLDTHESVVKLDVKKGQLVFLKHAEGNIPLNTVIDGGVFLRDFFSKAEVHPDDLYKFEVLTNLKILKKRCDEKEDGVLFSFREKHNNEYRWIRIIISIPASYSEDSPYILLYRRNLPLWESDHEAALEFFLKKILKVVKHNMTTNTMRVLRQRPSEAFIRRKHSRKNLLPEEWVIEESLIHPDDLSHFQHFTDRQFVIDFFHDGNEELCFFYRRKIGSFFRWVKFSITRSTEYDETNHIFLYIIENIDMILTNLLDQHGFFQYSTLKASQTTHEEIYYDNLLHVLSYFTQRYIDFYMVDLKRDLYIMYKIKQENVSGSAPYVGKYSSMIHQLLHSDLPKEQQDALRPLASSDSLREQLTDKASIEFTYTHPSGQIVKTICTKIESINGMPSKVICCTVPYQSEHQLRIRTFGNFEVLSAEGNPIKFTRKQGKELLAYLIDKQGYPASSQDIIQDIFERDPEDLNAIKYVSTIYRSAAKALEKAGYPNIIIKEWNSLRVDTEKVDCDYYRLLNGDVSYLHQYHNEYMKEYSWAEETNAEILHYSSR